MSDIDLQKLITNHLKNYGFIIPNSEIYNGLANAWDFGPLGALSSFKLKQLWLDQFVFSRDDIHLIDSNIIFNPAVWKASGHLDNFSDLLIDCKSCKKRFRPDQLLEAKGITVTDAILKDIDNVIAEKITCPNCGKKEFTKARNFNLMFKTSQNLTDDEEKNAFYLRPETAQGIFINYSYVMRTMRLKIPFGIAQIGKAFRNEITPGNFIFRTREFEQMEIEWFCEEKNALADFEKLKNTIYSFLTKQLKIAENKIQLHEQTKDELAHYARKTVDFRFHFPHGWDELLGLAYRGNFDLMCHQKSSGNNFEYFDVKNNQRFVPHVIEPSFGLNRLFYAIFTNAYTEEQLPNQTSRVVLKLPASIAPYEVAVLPLVKKNETVAKRIFRKLLAAKINCCIDYSGSIGKKYRRQDAIGTPLCVTVDFDSMKKTNPTVTIRNRDTMEQKKCKIESLVEKIKALIKKM